MQREFVDFFTYKNFTLSMQINCFIERIGIFWWKEGRGCDIITEGKMGS